MSEKFIKVYDDFIPDNICDVFVRKYEETLENDGERVEKESLCYRYTRDDGHKICGNCNCRRMNPHSFDTFQGMNEYAIDEFLNILTRYKEDCGFHKNQWPAEFGYEELRMKRFLCDTDEKFGLHADIVNLDGAKRFLGMLIYLNDDFDGGETIFPQFDISIKPKKGRIIIFPPFWTYMHHGAVSTNGFDKYFLMTFLNYLPETQGHGMPETD